jgi:dihydroorotate dehydrogenase
MRSSCRVEKPVKNSNRCKSANQRNGLKLVDRNPSVMSRSIQLSNLIEDLREITGWTLAQIARQFDVDRSTVETWQTDPNVQIRASHLEALERICSQQGLDVADYTQGPPLWSLSRTYGENLNRSLPEPPELRVKFKEHNIEIFGCRLNSRFGISSGIASASPNQVYYLSRCGADFIVMKTVVGSPRRPYHHENVLFCMELNHGLDADSQSRPRVVVEPQRDWYRASRGMVVHFGLPSLAPEQWAARFVESHNSLLPGQCLVLSVAGAVEHAATDQELLDSFRHVTECAAQRAHAKIIELNISCNASSRLIYCDPNLSGTLCADARAIVGPDVKLIAKIGPVYGQNLSDLLLAIGPHVDGVAAINAVPVDAMIVDPNRRLRFAWEHDADRVGLTGQPIISCALRTLREIHGLRNSRAELHHITIVGQGGISHKQDVLSLLQYSDVVLAHSIFLEDSHFAIKVRRLLDKQLSQFAATLQHEQDLARSYWLQATKELRCSIDHSRLIDMERAAGSVIHEWLAAHENVVQLARARRARTVPNVNDFKTRILSRMVGEGNNKVL